MEEQVLLNVAILVNKSLRIVCHSARIMNDPKFLLPFPTVLTLKETAVPLELCVKIVQIGCVRALEKNINLQCNFNWHFYTPFAFNNLKKGVRKGSRPHSPHPPIYFNVFWHADKQTHGWLSLIQWTSILVEVLNVISTRASTHYPDKFHSWLGDTLPTLDHKYLAR